MAKAATASDAGDGDHGSPSTNSASGKAVGVTRALSQRKSTVVPSSTGYRQPVSVGQIDGMMKEPDRRPETKGIAVAVNGVI